MKQKLQLNRHTGILAYISNYYMRKETQHLAVSPIKYIGSSKICKKSTSVIKLGCERLFNPNPLLVNNLVNILKLVRYLAPQLLPATQTYCIRTHQGQHYHRDVACLEQEFNFTPDRGRFKSIGDSLVAVKTILPIQKFKFTATYFEINLLLFDTYVLPYLCYIAADDSCEASCLLYSSSLSSHSSSHSSSSLAFSSCCQSIKMSSTPWNFQLRRVTVVAPKSGRMPKRNTRDPRLPSYRPPQSPTQFTGTTINIPLEYSPLLDAKKPVRRFGPERTNRVLDHSHPNKIKNIYTYIYKLSYSSPPNKGC